MLELDQLPGQSQAKTYLAKLLLVPPSTLLFEGPKGVGKASFAKAFAQALLSDASSHKFKLSHHPDLREFYPEGKAQMHPMQVMKQLIEQTQIPPFESKKKVFILYEADRMLPSSSNALLKTLEEPPEYAHFILVSSKSESILPTIVSRCFKVSFSQLSVDEITAHLEKSKKKRPDEARSIAWRSHGSLMKAEALAEKKDDCFLELVAQAGVAALHQSYHHLFSLLSEVESLIEKDPAISSEDVLSAFYYWYRDLHLLNAGGDRSLLFFRDQEESLKKCLICPLPDLPTIQKKMEQIEVAEECHINLRHSLAELLI